MGNQIINPNAVAKELDIVVSNLKQIQTSTSQGSKYLGKSFSVIGGSENSQKRLCHVSH
jgi:hypothetical protein